jgi:hypothetical protein
VRRFSDREVVKPVPAHGPDAAPAGIILYAAAAAMPGDSDIR